MKQILIFISLLIQSVCCTNSLSSQTIQNDLVKLELFGSVKSCKETLYQAVNVNGKIVNGDFYDNQKSKSKILHFTKDGINDIYSYLDENDSILRSIKYVYNESNQKIRQFAEDYEYSFHKIDSTLYTYHNNKLMREEWFIGQYHGLRTYTYNRSGFLIADSVIDQDGLLKYRNTWKRDEKGNEIENVCYFEGKQESRTYKDYDKDNRLIYEAIYYPNDENSRPLIRSFTFNSNGQVIQVLRYSPDKKILGKDINSYYKNGLIQKVETNDIENDMKSIHSYEYEYDHRGNWIRKISYYNEKPTIVYVREISYY